MNEKLNESLADNAEAAFKQAATKVVQRAKQTGTPIAVWEEGHVNEVSPEQLERESSQVEPEKAVP